MRYIPELDGLRAFAVIAVILFHSAPGGGTTSGGFVGVDLFFVLSAFLITGVLEQQPIRAFYIRRFLRLTPALMFLLAGYLLVGPLLWPGYPIWRDALLAGLYVSDYTLTFWGLPGHLGHTWSLAVEEHFYLLWPFILPYLKKARRPGAWLAGAYVALTLWRLLFISDMHDYYFRFDTHATGLVAGAWLYFVRPRISGTLAASGALLLGVILFGGNINWAYLYITPAEIASALVIGWAAANRSAVLRSTALVTIGKLSYAMYLWQGLIAFAVRDHYGFAATALITFIGSFLMAAVSWFTVEAAGRKLRDRLSKSGEAAPVVLAGQVSPAA